MQMWRLQVMTSWINTLLLKQLYRKFQKEKKWHMSHTNCALFLFILQLLYFCMQIILLHLQKGIHPLLLSSTNNTLITKWWYIDSIKI